MGGGGAYLYMNMGSLDGIALEVSSCQLVVMSPLPLMMYCTPTSMWPGPLAPSQRSVGSCRGTPGASCSSDELIGLWLCIVASANSGTMTVVLLGFV